LQLNTENKTSLVQLTPLWQTIYLGGGKYLDHKYHSQYYVAPTLFSIILAVVFMIQIFDSTLFGHIGPNEFCPNLAKKRVCLKYPVMFWQFYFIPFFAVVSDKSDCPDYPVPELSAVDKPNLSLYLLYYAEACNEFVVLISAL